MSNPQEDDKAVEVVPVTPQSTMVFIHRAQFTTEVPGSRLPLVAGFTDFVPGRPNTIVVRRILTELPNFKQMVKMFLSEDRKIVLAGVEPPTTGPWGVGVMYNAGPETIQAVYYTDITDVEIYHEMRPGLPVVEEVAVMSYAARIDITDKVTSRVRLAHGNVPRNR